MPTLAVDWFHVHIKYGYFTYFSTVNDLCIAPTGGRAETTNERADCPPRAGLRCTAGLAHIAPLRARATHRRSQPPRVGIATLRTNTHLVALRWRKKGSVVTPVRKWTGEHTTPVAAPHLKAGNTTFGKLLHLKLTRPNGCRRPLAWARLRNICVSCCARSGGTT